MVGFESIALFGVTGQLGQNILDALVSCQKQQFKEIKCFAEPGQSQFPFSDRPNVSVIELDVLQASQQEIAKSLQGTQAVVSALNGPALDAQYKLQDAAADAGVNRFYPSEYGMHHIYRKPDSEWGYIHPMWDKKARFNEACIRHPAINSGAMTYTLIGCGDFYNQEREKTWCPWTQLPKDVGDAYTIHVVGDPDAEADYTHLADFAQYLAGTLCEPEKSENKELNFPSDTISSRKIKDLLERYTGKPVVIEVISQDKWHEVVNNPESAPQELSQGSAFPVDFWFLVKGTQGAGKFFRPKSQCHNSLFPEVKPTTFEKYFQNRFK